MLVDAFFFCIVIIHHITTINQPRFQLGFVACNILCEKIRNPNAEQQTVLMETELVIRESTSAIR